MAASADEGQRLPEGVLVGHWADPVGRTGCTVILAPAGPVAGVDVRGAAASTLSSDTLRPGTLVERAHATPLTGGRAVGPEGRDGTPPGIRPSATMYDGDTLFCRATGAVEASYDAVESAAAKVVARAIADGVRAAQPPTADPDPPSGAETRAAP